MRMDPVVNRFIHVMQGIVDQELSWYYRNCLATIYPSKYEGWGLPVGESLAQGKLCLASNATSIPEIGKDLPQYFEPHDAAALARLVERVIEEPAWVKEREDLIRASYQPTEWRDTAKQILEVIDSLG
jgi:glycosyltransferase involved in cell wall biosynthesis